MNLLRTPTSYRLPWSHYHNAEPWMRMEIIACRFDESGDHPTLWCVREGGACLSTDLDFEIEPSPSSRDEDFIKRTRFHSPSHAAQVALEWATKNGKL